VVGTVGVVVVVVGAVDGVVDVVSVVVSVAVVVTSEVVVSTPSVSERETRAPVRAPAKRRITAPAMEPAMSFRLRSLSGTRKAGRGSLSPGAG
jgi:hypothetical protein